MAPFMGLPLVAPFVIDGNHRHLTSPLKMAPRMSIEPAANLSQLCSLFEASPVDLLSLRTKEGIRGVYVERSVFENDTILKIPLKSCLRDDMPPQWLTQIRSEDNEEEILAVSVEGWVTRLTACLLDARMDNKKSKAMQEWLDLLPRDLKEHLPIHWSPELLACTKCRRLELAVDSAYFARAGPIGDLMSSMKAANFYSEQSQIEDALDLVQTRSCRVESSDDGTPNVRLVVPVFDMINHNRNHNAEFLREGDFVVVRAIKDIDEDSEVFVNYGGATQPSWKCLLSYGFVPLSEDVYEDDTAELIVDDMIFEVGPTEIPFELVQYEAEKLGQYAAGEDVEFTTEIGENIIKKILDASSELATASNTSAERGGEAVAFRAIADFKESNRRTLLACAEGLREYLEGL